MSDAHLPDDPLKRFLGSGHALHVAADGQMQFFDASGSPPAPAILPGSFNPVHQGHWRLAQIAATILDQPVAFELSVVNVDKPPLTRAEIRRRLTPFHGQASVWLTEAPKFLDKAERFPGATFVVGADTALRIVAPKYYDDDPDRMSAALSRIETLNCRFLVACRVDAQGQCWRLGDLPILARFAHLFAEIPPEQFRWDVSSTALRAATNSDG